MLQIAIDNASSIIIIYRLFDLHSPWRYPVCVITQHAVGKSRYSTMLWAQGSALVPISPVSIIPICWEFASSVSLLEHCLFFPCSKHIIVTPIAFLALVINIAAVDDWIITINVVVAVALVAQVDILIPRRSRRWLNNHHQRCRCRDPCCPVRHPHPAQQITVAPTPPNTARHWRCSAYRAISQCSLYTLVVMHHAKLWFVHLPKACDLLVRRLLCSLHS